MDYKRQNLKKVLSVLIVIVVLCGGVMVVNGKNYQKYTNKDTYYNCMNVDKYGDEGNEEGVVRKTKTWTQDYLDVYGLFFETYYMKDIESATQKYDSLLKEAQLSHNNETLTNNGNKIVRALVNNDVNYYILNDKTVFKVFGEKANIHKNQRWFDNLKIDYTVPMQ